MIIGRNDFSRGCEVEPDRPRDLLQEGASCVKGRAYDVKDGASAAHVGPLVSRPPERESV